MLHHPTSCHQLHVHSAAYQQPVRNCQHRPWITTARTFTSQKPANPLAQLQQSHMLLLLLLLLLRCALCSRSLMLPPAAPAAAVPTVQYVDPAGFFKLLVPRGWQQVTLVPGTGESPAALRSRVCRHFLDLRGSPVNFIGLRGDPVAPAVFQSGCDSAQQVHSKGAQQQICMLLMHRRQPLYLCWFCDAQGPWPVLLC
jgi:hypothetical protein